MNMSKKILIISTSPRKNGNSAALASEFADAAQKSGAEVEMLELSDMKISFCRGCLACQKTGKCVIRDDASTLLEKLRTCEAVAFATPVYFYEMSGQMKTLLDRTNPLFGSDYKFRQVYLIASAADADENAVEGAKNGLLGWLACFDKAKLCGVIRGAGLCDTGDAAKNKKLVKAARELGKSAAESEVKD